jgi:hypothetical protein
LLERRVDDLSQFERHVAVAFHFAQDVGLGWRTTFDGIEYYREPRGRRELGKDQSLADSLILLGVQC